METFTLRQALLSTQKALLKVVTPDLRAVIIDIKKEEKIFYIHFYYHGEISKELINLWSHAITEASTEFGPNCILDGGIERVDYPNKIPIPGTRYAYCRKE